MTTTQIAAAIAAFATDLSNSIDMRDRKNAVQFLAGKIGPDDANRIAIVFGLNSTYYFA